MNRAWIFQANPQHFDIDGALHALDQIWWRAPQYASEIQVGDIAVVWRSGKDPGVVAVGRVLGPPQLHASDDADTRFVLDSTEGPEPTTRVLLSLSRSELFSKVRVASIPELSEHRIIQAPMGTVFPLSSAEWLALAPHLPAPPEAQLQPVSPQLPPVFAWEQRAKGVVPMPGGYGGYLDAARRICGLVDDLRPSSAELVDRLRQQFSVTATAARLRESFLRKIGVIEVDAGICQVGEWARRWIQSNDDGVVIALLHSRCRFIGEMLAELDEPRSTDELLSIVNERYGMVWDTHTQVSNRRGWLQSARLVQLDSDGRLVATESGKLLASRLQLYVPAPSTQPVSPGLGAPASSAVEVDESSGIPAVTSDEVLAQELEESSTDSASPDRFERAVRDIFSFLGFEATWLGGPGKTDVLLDAPLGKAESYRVTVDAKTTGTGSLHEQQVDWTTLVEHRQKHEADYAVLVAPNPSGGRLLGRATNHRVAVLSAKQLAGLCRQHARAPLGLAEYRTLFSAGGEVDTTELDELAENAARVLALAVAVCEKLAAGCAAFGRLTARDLWITLADAESGEVSSEEEIQGLLDALASPLIWAVDGDATTGYVLASSLDVTAARLRLLGKALLGESRVQP